MASYAFVIPILPGMADRDRQFGAEVCGPRKAEHEASRERLEITVERAWQQETPDGMVSIVYIEAEDIDRALAGIGSPETPYDQWWLEEVRAVHGVDPARPVAGPPNDQIIDFHRR